MTASVAVPLQKFINMAPGAGAACYNGSHCTFPKQCLVESGYRRYCADSLFVPVAGRTLFDLSGRREPGVHGCDRCEAPLAVSDFGLMSDVGTYVCDSSCRLPNNSSTPDTVVESYQTSNCLTRCTFAPAELRGNATLDISPHFPGGEPADEIAQLRGAAARARRKARQAELEAVRARRVARAELDAKAATQADAAALRDELKRAEAALHVAEYLLDRARRRRSSHEEAAQYQDKGYRSVASASELRSAHGAVVEAEGSVEAAALAVEAAEAAIAAFDASTPSPPSTEATAPQAEAVVAELSATRAAEAARAAATAADVGGLRVLPLSAATAGLWQRDDAWGGAARARPAGGLLQLTRATALRERRRPSAGYAILRPGVPLHAFVCELDVLIASGDGGEGLALSYGPPNDAAMRASIREAAGAAPEEGEGAEPSDAAAAGGGQKKAEEVADGDGESAPAASASLGLGASVDRGPTRRSTKGTGLSVSLATRPHHAAMVWYDGERLAHVKFEGCPRAETGVFGGSCVPCAVCPSCPPCEPCRAQQECPLRPGRAFARLVVRLRAATSERPTTVQATHDGVDLFPHPVGVPGFTCDDKCELVLSAATSAEFDDDHWVDNLRLASAPGRPVPPALVNATTTSVALAWTPPHHGGDPITLYRLQRRDGALGWRTLYVGPRRERTVGGLPPASRHLFRVHAYNSVGWSVASHVASYSTAVPPVTSDVKPPHEPKSAAGLVRCGGRLYAVGGQHLSSAPGVGGARRTYLRTLEQYDAATRSWFRRAPMRTPRSHPLLGCVRERTLLVTGGFGTLGEAPHAYEGPLVSSEEYDPATDTWFERDDCPTARYHGAAASEPEGHVFVAGGWGATRGLSRAAYGTHRVLSAFDRYDPHSAVWVRKAPMPFAAYGLGLGIFDCSRRCLVLAAGGHLPDNSFSAAAALYDPRSGAWELVAPLPAPRFGLTILAQADEPHAYAAAARRTPSAQVRVRAPALGAPLTPRHGVPLCAAGTLWAGTSLG